MRTIALSIILLVLIPLAVAQPWIGVLGWTWISTMNPHRLTFGFLMTAPVAAAVGGATLIGLLLTKNRRMPPMNSVTITLLVFVAWILLTSAFALHRELIGEMFSKIMKMQLMFFVTMALLFTRLHLRCFLWVIGVSVGFFGIKGGIFTLVGGGRGSVEGPPGGFIAGNNELGLAMVMIIPVLFFLRQDSRNMWVRLGLLGAILLTAIAILGTHSRGALVAIVAMSLYLWWSSDRKVALGLGLVIVAAGMLAFMPASWDARMQSIANYQNDSSAMGRINAWWMALHLAQDRFLGGGLEIITPDLFARYAPNPADLHAQHSIYFQVLGEHGFVGLFIFVLLWFLTWRTAAWVARHGRAVGLDTEARMGTMVQVSLVGYLSGGAFLSLAYYDLPYNMLIVAVLARQIVQTRMVEEKVAASDGSQVVVAKGAPAIANSPHR